MAVAESDVIADSLCVFVNVGCGLFKTPQYVHSKQPRSVSTVFTDHSYTVFTYVLFSILQVLFVDAF